MTDRTGYRRSPNTAIKQSHLRHILHQTMGRINGVRLSKSWACQHMPIYFDLFAGPGREPDGTPGSPLIFCEIAAQQPYPFEAHFYEYDAETALQLAQHLTNDPNDRDTYHLHTANNMTVAEVLPVRPIRWRYGIAYADPSNADLVGSLNPLRLIAIAYPHVDIVLNYAAASWKRQIELDHYQCLLDLLPTFPKQRWFIREPIDCFQWTMLIGTNYLDYRASERRRWHDIRTTRGNELLMRAALTREQLAERGVRITKQLALPLGDK